MAYINLSKIGHSMRNQGQNQYKYKHKRRKGLSLGKIVWYGLLGLGAFWIYENYFTMAKPAIAPASATARMHGVPIQENIHGDRGISFHEGRLQFLATYDITARVLKKAYYNDGKNAELSPVDLALGWGEMADYDVYSQLSITQSGRFYHYSWPDTPPINPGEIVRSSANVHIIPADNAVKKKIDSIREGQVVHLRGYLVHYKETRPDGGWWEWRSSLVRTDKGKGACEVFYVVDATAY